jgi:hypothetical protein
MRPFIPFTAALLALSGCAALHNPHDPARSSHNVSLVNSLAWTNAVSGNADALRTAWPLSGAATQSEQFALAQVKRCDAAGACSWGVVKAQRTISAPRYVAGGVALDLELALDVDRRHEVVHGGEKLALAIPADVAALAAKRTVRQPLVLTYGKVERIELDFGIGYNICAQRIDAAGKPVEACTL